LIQEEMPRARNQNPGSFSLSKTVVASASFGVAVIALAALAVVASIKNANTLSTVALSLALMSFVLQILIFVVQTYAINNQMLDAQRLYGEMRDALADIKARAEGTQSVVERVSDRLLEAALGKAAAESRDAVDVTSPEFARRVREVLRGAEEGSDTTDAYPPSTRDPAAYEMMRTWPTGDAAQEAAGIASGLGETARGLLARFAIDELKSQRPGAQLGPGLYSGRSPGIEELTEGDLLEVVPGYVGEEGDLLRRLTPAGRHVARLFTANPPPPPELQAFYEGVVLPTWREVPSDRRPYPLPAAT
jgi:hypothetical protein